MHHAMIVAERARVVARHYSDRILRLIDEGFVVHVAAGDDGGFGELPAGVLARPLPTSVAALPGAYVLLQAHIIEHAPLLVHGIGTPWAWLAALAARSAQTPAVFATVEHHLVGEGAELPGVVELLRSAGLPTDVVGERAYQWLAARVDRYLTTTEDDLRLADAWTPGQKLDLVVGGRGADVQALNPYDSTLEPVEDLRSRLSSGASRLWVGTIVDEEGIDGLEGLAELSRRLVAARPDASFFVGLDPLGPPELARRARAIDAPWSVVDVTEPIDFLRSLDAFVATRSADPYGGAAMLAAAASLPIVAESSRALREVVLDRETGRLVDFDGLETALVELLDDPAARRRWGVRARTRAVERFDRRQVDDQMLRLYDNVLRGKMG